VSANVAAIIGAAAGVAALAALILCAALARRLRALRADQAVVLGGEHRDVVEHAAGLDRALAALQEELGGAVERLDRADAGLSERLEGAIDRCAVIRYDAMGEMSGRQSSSVALLDSHSDGVVLSSILHRESARLYAKPIRGGRSELELSPEEEQALTEAGGVRA